MGRRRRGFGGGVEGLEIVSHAARVVISGGVSNGRQTWVELKAPKAPKRETTRVLGSEGCRTSQISWHLKAASMNVPSYILIRDDMKRHWLIDGMYADSVNDWEAKLLDRENLIPRTKTPGDAWRSIFMRIA